MEEFNKEKFYDDIKYMFEHIKEIHPNLFYNISEEELNSLIENYLSDDKINTFESSIYYLSTIFAKVGDSHTKVNEYSIPSLYKYDIINGECVVIDTIDDKVLIGSTLESINGVPISQIIKELSVIISPRTKEGIIARCSDYLSNKAVLRILPSINSSDEIEYTFKVNGEIYKTKEDINSVNYNRFPEKKYYEYEVIDNIMVIKYRKCRNMDEYPFEEFAREISNIDNIEGYVIDIRGNTGGNSDIIKPLIEFLKDKNTVTLVDNYVFSSGIMALLDLKNIGSKIIGTHTAEHLNSFGDILKDETPNYNLMYMYSKKYFTLQNGDYISLVGKKEYDDMFSNPNNNYLRKPMDIEPDIYAKINKESIINGNDNVLELGISEIKSKRLS